MNRLSFRTRIIAGYVIILLFFVIIGLFVLTRIKNIRNNTEMLYQHPFVVSNSVRDINFNVITIFRTTRNLFNVKDEKQVTDVIDSISYCDSIIINRLDVIYDRFLGDKNVILNFKKNYSEWIKVKDELIELKKAGKDSDAMVLREKVLSKYNELIFLPSKYISDFAQNKAGEFYRQAIKEANDGFYFLFVFTFTIFLLSVIIAFVISKSISAPIKKVVLDLRNIYSTKGDFETETVSEQYLLEKTAGQLKAAYDEIQRYGEELKATNEELASTNEELASANEEIKKFNESLEKKIELRTRELRQSEFFFRESQKAAKIGSYKINFSTGFWEASTVLDEIFGINEEYKKSINGWLDIIHPADKQMISDYIVEEVIKKQIKFDKEYRIRRVNDQQECWVHGLGVCEFDPAGNILSMIGTIQDITERKKIEEKITRSEKELSMIVNHINDALFRDDVNGRVVYANRRFFELYGFTPGDLSDIKLEDYIAPGWQELLRNRHDRRVRGEQVDSSFEYQGIRTDGTLMWLEVNVAPVYDENGNLKGTQSVVRDVTERKNAEEKIIASEKRYHSTLDSMLEGAQIVGFDWRYLYVNDAFVSHSKYTRKELLGHTVLELYPGIEETPVYEAYLKCFNERVSIRMENEFVFPDKSVSWFDLSFQPVPEGIFILSIDITERKLNERKLMENQKKLKDQSEEYYALYEEYKSMNEDLEKAKNKAEEADKLKSSFLANLSHEVRTPMNSILGFSEILLRQKPDPESQHRFLTLINSSTNQLLSIINDIVNISKLEVKMEKVFMSSFHLGNLMKEILSVMTLEKQRKSNLEIILENKDDDEIILLSDEVKLRQILINLVKNAIKFTKNGYVKFGYSVKDDFIHFFVSDTGCGIAADKQQIVFERFRQSDESIAVTYGGNGLGLAISKGYVELLGGRIWLESELNVGTTVFFTIPYYIGYTQADTLYSGINLQLLEHKTILIAEDAENNVEYLRLILEPHSVKLLIANDGRKAVNICETEQVDIVLMDVQMPEMNGIMATKLIREKHPHLPVICVSAFCSAEDMLACKNAGCSSFVAKPFKPEMLLDEIITVLGKHKKE